MRIKFKRMLPAVLGLLSISVATAQDSLIERESQVATSSYANLSSQGDYSVRAQLVALNKTILSAGITAQVADVYFTVGEKVQEGDVLIQFDCAALNAQKKMYQAQEEIGRINMNVNQRLFDLNNIGSQELDLTRAELASATAQVDVLDVELDMCRIEAPFSGTIVERAVEPYQTVAEGTEVLELLSVEELEVLLVTPSSWLPWLDVEEEFTLVVDEIQESFTGKVTRLGGRVDPVSQTFLVYGELLEGSQQLLPGMSGNIFFEPN